jgi:hypothetical protein
MNNPSSEINEKICEYCGSKRTYMAVTKNGTSYPKWNCNPCNENSMICGKCYKNLLYHKVLPLSHVRRGIRMKRIADQIYFQYENNIADQKIKGLNT